jgi:DNA-binding CsgD family transcriptional regulator
MSVIASMLGSKTYPLDENNEFVWGGPAMALVTLSHTPAERRLYAAMLSAAESHFETLPTPSAALSGSPIGKSDPVFTVRRLKGLAGIGSLSTIRRGLEGLVAKLSVEREAGSNGSRESGAPVRGAAYRVFTPEEVIARRAERGFKQLGNGSESHHRDPSFERVIHRVLENRNLSQREVQVSLCCVEGLTNAEIGSRLQVSKQTVKFHLRNIFVKFGVKRRAELISRLLR